MNLRAELAGSVDLFAVHRHDPETFPFLLESVAGHPSAGRYDILFAFPGERLSDAAVFAELGVRNRALGPQEAEDLPFLGGWFLLLGYEAVRFIEPRLRLPAAAFRAPDALAVRCPAAIIHDRLRQRTHLLAEDDQNQINYMKNIIHVIENKDNDVGDAESALVAGLDEDAPQRFVDGVGRVREYLRAGDVFQVNLSRGWRAELRAGTGYAEVYARLRRSNPAPFAGLARLDADTAVLSSSPERLVQVRGRQVQTRPIAGTRPRHGDDGDPARRQELMNSIKERAEHIMLIDLERNDLGRVCRPGSVEVNELMCLETYAHVHHIVSNVRGTLRDDVDAGEVLAAVFPGGTITGCPKVRAMEIIGELEGVGRGPYTGSMGYLSRCGQLDTNILIRSMLVQDGSVSFRAGAGIVADSEAEAELAETRAKARGMAMALGAPV